MKDIKQIMDLLPHRYPFLLVDRILEMEENKRIVGIKNVTMNEPFFQGHFPGEPIMPGVLIVEAMAQSAGILHFLSTPEAKSQNAEVRFLGIDKCRFRRPVIPGPVPGTFRGIVNPARRMRMQFEAAHPVVLRRPRRARPGDRLRLYRQDRPPPRVRLRPEGRRDVEDLR